MKIKTEKLKEILNIINTGFKDGKSIVHSETITDKENSYIFNKSNIIVFNERGMCFIYPIETGLECTINQDTFHKALSKIEDEEIDIKYDDGKVTFKAGKKKGTLVSGEVSKSILKKIDNINLDDIADEWIEFPKDFIEGLTFCQTSLSNVIITERFYYIHVNNKKIVSSDEISISQYTMNKSVKNEFYIPEYVVSSIIKLKPTHYFIEEDEGVSWMYLKNKTDLIFYFPFKMVEFMDIDKKLKLKGTEIKFPKELKKAVEYVSVVAEGDFDVDKRVGIHISENLITCKADNSKGSLEEQIEFEYKGKNLSFELAPIMLNKIIDGEYTAIIADDRLLLTTDKFKHIMAIYK